MDMELLEAALERARLAKSNAVEMRMEAQESRERLRVTREKLAVQRALLCGNHYRIG
jgi:hypothetical protein